MPPPTGRVLALGSGLMFFTLNILFEVPPLTAHLTAIENVLPYFEIPTEPSTKSFSSDNLRPSTSDLIRETNISLLWNADASFEIRQYNLQQVGLVELSVIISHCDKPLDWIIDYFTPPRRLRARLRQQVTNYTIEVQDIEVVTKCGGNKTQLEEFVQQAKITNITKHAPVKITTLPNVGRCDHTYAQWLDHFSRHKLAQTHDNHVIVFLKDNDHRRTLRKSLYHLDLHHLLGTAITMGFACFEQERMGVLRKNSARNITAVYHKSAYHSLHDLRLFYMDEYQREVSRDTLEEFLSSDYKTMGDWLDALQLKLHGSVAWNNKTLIPLCVGGMFAVTAGQLRRNPNDWSKLANSLSRGNNIVEGHYTERSWAAMLSSPLEEKQAELIGSLVRHQATFDGNPWHPTPGRLYGEVVGDAKRYRNAAQSLVIPC